MEFYAEFFQEMIDIVKKYSMTRQDAIESFLRAVVALTVMETKYDRPQFFKAIKKNMENLYLIAEDQSATTDMIDFSKKKLKKPKKVKAKNIMKF